MSPVSNKLRIRLVIGGILLTLLLAAVFTLGSLDVPFEPSSWRVLIPLYAVSTFITAALLVFGLILIRSFVRLQMERNKAQLGARFKTKMVLGATAISLLPVIFMFFVSYSLLNRTLGRWFPRPLEIASDETQKLLNDLGRTTLPRLHMLAYQAATDANVEPEAFLQHAASLGLDAAWLFDEHGRLLKGGVTCANQSENRVTDLCTVSGVTGNRVRSLPSGVEIWQAAGKTYFAASIPLDLPNRPHATLVAAYLTSPDFLTRWGTIQAQTQEYEHVKQSLRALKRQMLLILFFFTILVLSAATWVALFLAKQVTVPIQALAEGTREVSAGNFDYQVPEQAQDELGVLIRSFNTMTTQLRDSRSQIDEFTRNLQQAVQELERRRQLMETVLENIPAGVTYMDAAGAIQRTNKALLRMFQIAPGEAVSSLETLVGPEANDTLQHLMRRALRMGVVTREIEVEVGSRLMHLAVTVSSLGPRRANTGYVLVFDDLTEVLRAQKSAAWQEVARRIAHEIKNPLTPIQLSAERLRRKYGKTITEDRAVFEQCTETIVRQVDDIRRMVDEFSRFARMPKPVMAPEDAADAVRQVVFLMRVGHADIDIDAEFSAESLPAKFDRRLISQALTNIIKNATEAIAAVPAAELGRGRIRVSTAREGGDIVIDVIDNGIGLPKENRSRLLEPYVTTREKGTGLGLAIVGKILEDHGGRIELRDAAEKTPGARGAWVRLRFAAEVVPPPSAPQPAAAAEATPASA